MTARRSQAERRASTISRLLDATIEAIIDVGYARASLGEICTRSGVSKGGMFRHFESRTALMVAAAEEVARRHIDAVRKTVAELGEPPSTDVVLRIVRDRIRAPENTVMFELFVAARTDPELRAGVTAFAEEYVERIALEAREVGWADVLTDQQLQLVFTTLQHTFDGEAIRRVVLPDEQLEAARLDLLAEFVEFVHHRHGGGQ